VLHCSQRRFWEPEFPEIDGEKGLNFAGWAKKLTGAATLSVGSVGLSSDFMASFAGEKSATVGLESYARPETLRKSHDSVPSALHRST
jgi:hypothetical protein